LGHFHLALALYNLKQVQEAYDTLRPVVEQFPQDWMMRYDLAYYACLTGRLKEAWGWLKKAIDLAGSNDIRLNALADKDLEQLWSRIGEF
jgi:Flp pilus assembly protein TadD